MSDVTAQPRTAFAGLPACGCQRGQRGERCNCSLARCGCSTRPCSSSHICSAGFPTATTIAPVAAGNPALIARPVIWSAQVMAQHIALYNTAFAVIQLSIAVGLFFRHTVKLALAASIAWAVMVWWFGEGLGGVLTGASPLAGVPGAVILYALIAVLIWPANRAPRAVSQADPNTGPC